MSLSTGEQNRGEDGECGADISQESTQEKPDEIVFVSHLFGKSGNRPSIVSCVGVYIWQSNAVGTQLCFETRAINL